MSGVSNSIEITAVRKRLTDSLGDNSKLYFQALR